MERKIVYADHAATTPVAPEVLEAMLPFLGESYYNPSALYQEARSVKTMIEKARSDLLELIGGDSDGHLIFTGSGTESVNMALCSAITGSGKRRILISAVEHHAVLNCANSFESKGFIVEQLPVDHYGVVSPDSLKTRIGNDVCLVSIMKANNETGAINDTAELCLIAHEGGARFHTDAVQALGVMPLSVKEMGADYISASAHKIYGPKGVGLMYAAPAAPIMPLIFGGKQENDARAGTENTAGIAGFGCAAGLLSRQLKDDSKHLSDLKQIFLEGIAKIPKLMVNSPPLGAP
ncbi:MAG: aminotransferase class V-fold PLP-dependent enzyme, partial [Treponema sp.]|nr:aminotransferase class V-fold PLP-dependent enzyme [Treponema sp.]